MNRARKNAAFYLEALLLVLFLLLSLTVLIRMMGAAKLMGEQARQESCASQILQNFTADLQNGQAAAALASGQTVLSRRYGGGAQPDEGGAYLATVRMESTPTASGQLVAMAVTVTLAAQPSAAPLCQVTTSQYLPAA